MGFRIQGFQILPRNSPLLYKKSSASPGDATIFLDFGPESPKWNNGLSRTQCLETKCRSSVCVNVISIALLLTKTMFSFNSYKVILSHADL